MNILDIILLVGAAICFLLGVIGVRAGSVNWVALGLLFWAIALVISASFSPWVS